MQWDWLCRVEVEGNLIYIYTLLPLDDGLLTTRNM
jgi:hypothetical protein